MAEAAGQSKTRRVTVACRFCRYSKLKCSGSQPCDRCQKRSRECVYEDAENYESLAPPRKRLRIEVTPRRAPQDNNVNPNHRSPLPATDDSSPATQNLTSQARDRHQIVTASIVDNIDNRDTSHPADLPEATVRSDANQSIQSPLFLRNRPDKRKRRWLYLGASSTWTFNIRVASLIRTHLGVDQDNSPQNFTLDGDAYTISLRKVNSDSQPDLSRLPSLDYAIYLINTVKFQVGDILRLFDEEEFLKHLHDFYSKGQEKVGTHRLWFTQCLLLLALGKGFLNSRKSPENTSSAEFFSRAISILPDVFTLHEEPILAVEVLTTIALYFYCVDMKQSAYSYIGQALRILLVEGAHVPLPSADFGEQFAERCRKLWWTVYILDRTLSSAVGAPVTVQDDHISQPLGNPRQASQRDATLIMHVKLCRIVSYILTELYTADGSLEHSYLTKTRTVLRHMAQIAQELEDTIDFKFKNSLETLSKGALYLRLLYNQCIILATRPLLLCLLQQILRSTSANGQTPVVIPNSIRDLLQTCVDSATKTLKMLWALNDHNLLDTFLPFNLEFACSAASILIVTDDVLKGIPVSISAKSLIPKVLNEIIAGGNKAAPLRLKEIQQLQGLAEHFWEDVNIPDQGQTEPTTPSLRSHQVVVPETSTQPQGNADSAAQTPQQTDNNTYTSLLLTDVPDMGTLSSSSTDFAQTFDFSQEQMLSLADHLDADDISSMLGFNSNGLNEWF